MKRMLAALLLGLAAGMAQAEASAVPQGVVTSQVGTQLSSAERQKAEDLANLLASQALSSLHNSPKALDYQKQAATVARRADDIANATMAQDRASILKFLGLNPDGESSLFYFVSWSMPVEILRSYVIEAMWAGGTLVFRGIPPDMDLKTYITKQLSDLVYGKGASAAISLDPRLFDAYEVKTVPTIVYTEDRRNFDCFGVNQKTLVVDKKEIPMYTCPPLDPSKYWKISGALTTDYALRQIIDAGGKGAKPYLDALAKGFATGEKPPKQQQAFTGEWKAAITPADLKAIKEATEAVQLQQNKAAQ